MDLLAGSGWGDFWLKQPDHRASNRSFGQTAGVACWCDRKGHENWTGMKPGFGFLGNHVGFACWIMVGRLLCKQPYHRASNRSFGQTAGVACWCDGKGNVNWNEPRLWFPRKPPVGWFIRGHSLSHSLPIAPASLVSFLRGCRNVDTLVGDL